ncbi:MAG: hypothetical protein QM737_19655 [Ferruginibacter sp.]
MKPVQIILEILGWLTIVFVTTALTALFAFLIYLKRPTEPAKIVCLGIIGVGFICAAIWATRIWIKHGTIEWLSSLRRNS